MIAVDAVGQAHIVEPAPTDLVHVHAIPELTLADRCDRCGAAAQVGLRLAKSGLRLDLCAHHWRGHKEALEPLTDAIRDPRLQQLADAGLEALDALVALELFDLAVLKGHELGPAAVRAARILNA